MNTYVVSMLISVIWKIVHKFGCVCLEVQIMRGGLDRRSYYPEELNLPLA